MSTKSFVFPHNIVFALTLIEDGTFYMLAFHTNVSSVIDTVLRRRVSCSRDFRGLSAQKQCYRQVDYSTITHLYSMFVGLLTVSSLSEVPRLCNALNVANLQ